MDRNYITGLVLLFGLFVIWMKINGPSAEDLERQEFVRDSIEQVQVANQVANQVAEQENTSQVEVVQTPQSDSVTRLQNLNAYGQVGNAMDGEAKDVVLENELIELTFSSRGAQIKQAWLKEYSIIKDDSLKNEYKVPLVFMDNKDNEMGYILPLANGQSLNTDQLIFDVKSTKNYVKFIADFGNNARVIQTYSLSPNSYLVDYKFELENMGSVLKPGTDEVSFTWKNYLNKLEKNTEFEQMYSTLYYKEFEESTSYCSCRGDDTQDVDNMPIKWISNANQFFSANLISETKFSKGLLQTQTSEDPDVLKILTANLSLPIANSDRHISNMELYIGPNEYGQLDNLGHDMTDIIPFGWSIFGTINRWVIRPIFTTLHGFIGNLGIVILILTIIVKLAVFPLTYKMLYSQSKMAALKPVIGEIKTRLKDDSQAIQVETMKKYREYGVSPLGGCMPMVLQMPIWFALYRFFPASIEFRQAPFLWATDLSSYDAFFQFDFEIPFLGSHISLFTVLWVISLLAYTYYNSQHMDMAGANPMMKNMQYLMPLMFIFFLNKYAAGLTCYLLFSNVINIGQTLGTKKFLIDHEKIKEKLLANKAKPKKKGGFQARLEKAMQDQKKVEVDRQAQKKKKK